jgi:polyisoprenoid-binding protein YceI
MRLIYLTLVVAVSMLLAQEYRVAEGSYVAYEAPKRVFGVATTVEGNNSAVYGAVTGTSEGFSGTLHVPVADFDSGSGARDRDVAEMLQAQAHPEIRFEVVKIEGLQESAAGGEITVEGVLHLAGEPYPLSLKGRYERADDQLILQGRAEVRYETFGLKPPTMGLIVSRAADHLWLSGRIILAP